MLVVQGVLVAAFGVLYAESVHIAVCVSCTGFLRCFIWMGVLYKGKCYVSRWDRVARRAEKDLEEWSKSGAISDQLSPLFKYYDKAKRSEPIPSFFVYKYNTTTLMKWAVVVIMAFWLMAIIWLIIHDLLELFC
jgi:hypothetical protein